VASFEDIQRAVLEYVRDYQFAERLDCEPDYVSRIERGRENMTIASMVRLSTILDVDIVQLLGGERK
jgi:transcriptional regulator with XRE-family HTH domain